MKVLCSAGWHKWGAWSECRYVDPTDNHPHQTRTCQRCGAGDCHLLKRQS